MFRLVKCSHCKQVHASTAHLYVVVALVHRSWSFCYSVNLRQWLCIFSLSKAIKFEKKLFFKITFYCYFYLLFFLFFFFTSPRPHCQCALISHVGKQHPLFFKADMASGKLCHTSTLELQLCLPTAKTKHSLCLRMQIAACKNRPRAAKLLRVHLEDGSKWR